MFSLVSIKHSSVLISLFVYSPTTVHWAVFNLGYGEKKSSLTFFLESFSEPVFTSY